MIMTVEELRNQVDCGSDSDELITAKLQAVEAVIRQYTNNNFQQRAARFEGRSNGTQLYGNPQYFRVGDTVQISASGVNDGLCTILAVGADYIQVDKSLYEVEKNLVTKIVYPADVKQCAADLYRWKQTNGKKVGIKSETLSRHSVTYEDSASLYMGYPVGILNGLLLHRKARC